MGSLFSGWFDQVSRSSSEGADQLPVAVHRRPSKCQHLSRVRSTEEIQLAARRTPGVDSVE